MDFLSFSPFSLLLFYIPLLTTVSCFAINYLIYSRRVAQWKISNIPFLKPSFLIGHKYFLNLTKYSPLVSINRIYTENEDKDVVGFFLATIPMVMIRNPAIIKEVFARCFKHTFEKGMVGCRNDKIAQNVLSLCTDKDLWKSTRRTLLPMFATNRMSGTAFTKCKTQINRMLNHVEEAYRTGSPLDVRETANKFLLDCVSHGFFTLDSNSYEKPGDLYRIYTDLFEPSVRHMLRMYAQMQFTGAYVVDAFRMIGQKHVDLMTKVIRQQITERGQCQSVEGDFVDFLMGLEKGEEGGKQSSEMDITNQMIGFGLSTVFGGAWSSELSITLTTIHLLSLHPEHQERVRREVVEVMQKHKTSELTYDVVRDLQFLDQCLLEIARLYPTAPFLTRICSEDFQVPGTDYIFKKGEQVLIDPYSIHRDPKYFKNPDQFDPERFSRENKSTIPPECFLAFGIGPRKCPGDRLGLFRAATMIAALLHKFEIKPRSHLKQLEAIDFNPKSFGIVPREPVTVGVLPLEIVAQ